MQYLKLALLVFLPLALVTWWCVALYLSSQEEMITRELTQDAQRQLDILQGELREELDGLLEDLRLIASHEDLKIYLGQGGEDALQRLQSSWSQFSAAKRIYDQVRFIDVTGQERVRINYAGGNTVTVPPAQLQNKAGRYYFQDSIGLQPGQMFVSPLDLNIEQGRIEQPIKPMLRLAAPLFLRGELRGVVVLNFLANQLLRHLNTVARGTHGRMLLLNSEGYYLRGLSPELEWGFMYPQRDGAVRFQERFGQAWTAMGTKKKGQFEGIQGQFSFVTIRFPSEMADWNGSSPQNWTLVHYLAADAVSKFLSPVRQVSLVAGVVVTLLLGGLALYLAYLVTSSRMHRDAGVDLQTRLHTILTTAPDAIVSIDGEGRVESVNPAAERMFGSSFEQLHLMPLESVLPGIGETMETLATAQGISGAGGGIGGLRRELELRHPDGKVLPVDLALSKAGSSEDGLYIGILRDMTERHETAARIRRQALFDELTELPNRVMLKAELESALETAQRRRMYGALLFMDLDNFKTINDSLGHQTGDLLLKKVALRIGSCLRADDLVARLGGDEFVILLPLLNTEHRQASLLARDLGEKLRAALNRPILLEGHDYVVTPSIGVVLFPDSADNSEELLKQADTAMYRAKAAGRNTIRLFQPRMQAEAEELLSLSKELRTAISQGQLTLYLQPQIDAASEQVVGAEALLRWRHPRRGLLTPGLFMEQVEGLGLSGELGDWVLQQALQYLDVLLDHPSTAQLDFLAVNISPQHFRQPEFLPRLKTLLEETGVSPERLELEITENLLLQDIDEAAAKMQTLKEMAVRFAIDDFGTGFSSLSYLRKLPLTRLKIDRSFIDGVHRDPHNASIVDTIIAMARIQGLELTAEGVESEQEKDWLQQRGCHHIQGYLYSRPLPLDKFLAFCDERARAARPGEIVA
jgi:diguanylate cyclase (GGDEF)-like protein/PAS domain S-box-containing protein